MPPQTKQKKAALTAEDQFLTKSALGQTVAEAIARLELDRHQIRLAVLMQGKDVQFGEGGESVEDAIERLDTSIAAIKTEYADVLAEITA